MFTRTQHLLGACLALALASCATVPKPLQGEFASDIPTGGTLAEGAHVRWGGEVISVEPGAEGDVVVWDRDLSSAPAAGILAARPAATMLAGQVVFLSPQAASATDFPVAPAGESSPA